MIRFVCACITITCTFLFFINVVSATDYYVSTSGSNSNPGTSASPWKNINYAVDNINSGDTIFVKSGTYNEFVSISESGTSSNYKRLTNYNDDQVIITRGSYNRVGIDIAGSFWKVDGFHITQTGHPISIGGGRHHVEIKNLEVYDVDASLLANDGCNNLIIDNCNFYRPYDGGVNFIGLRGEDDDICYDITISDCSFDGCGHNSINLWDSGKDEDFHGLFDLTIEGCTFRDGTQVAIFTNHFAVERMIVRDCVFDNYQRGIQCVMRNCLIENCIVTNHKAHFVYCAADSKNSDVTVRGLKAHAQKDESNDRCICFQSCTGAEAYNNEISGNFLDANSDVIPVPPNPRPDPTQNPYPDPTHNPDPNPKPDPEYTPYPSPTPTPFPEQTNEFGYQNYSAIPEWESIINTQSGIVRHNYQYDASLTSRENAQQIYNPLNFGLPNNTNLCMGGGPLQWTYLRIIGPVYAIRYNNTIYSNSTDVIYEVGYLPLSDGALDDVTIDSVTTSDLYHKINAFGDDMLTINITCEWHKSKRTNSGVRKKYYTTILYQSIKSDIIQWKSVEKYNKTVECIVTNYSGLYNIIEMYDLPGRSSYYNISVKFENSTEYLLKSSHVFFKNNSVQYQLYDMFDYDFYELHGVSPHGKNQFMAHGGLVENISIIVSSPFESYELKTNITRIDYIKKTVDWYTFSFIMCFLIVYVLYRWYKL